MREYYPIEVSCNNTVCFLIWYTDEEDGYITESSKPLLFVNQNEMRQYAEKHDLRLENEITKYDFDIIVKWTENPETSFSCELFLDCWNFFSDLSKSTNRPYIGDFNTGNTIDVYHKLFYGSNLPAMRGDGEKYSPKWDEEEIEKIRNVLENGIALFMKAFNE